MTIPETLRIKKPSWRKIVAQYEAPSLRSSLAQIANTHIPYFALLCVMYLALDISYWITLALAFPAAGFLTRNFIIFHDCGHRSFFKSQRANRVFGYLTGLLTFMPSYYWSHQHAKHHAHSGDLDNRGDGDVWTATVQEYLAMSRWHRMWYRLYRNPIFLFGVLPMYYFCFHYRVWRRGDGVRLRWSTIRTNLGILAIVAAVSLTIGIKAYLLVQMPILIIASSLGLWLFYVQHQFEGTYWERHDKWSYVRHALEGSSFYKLPRILQWFSGNIGYHHLHHLSPRIPNYNLQKCHDSNKMFRSVPHITLWSSLKAVTYRLWDEERKKLVGFDYVPVYLAKISTTTA